MIAYCGRPSLPRASALIRTHYRVSLCALCIPALASTADVSALMAGVTPDTPAARIDPNVATSEFAGVGAIVIGGSTYSGVVIAPQYVLTAAHVGTAGAASAMSFVLNFSSSPWTSSVESVSVYPTYSFPYDDLAVLKLSTPVPGAVPVYPLFTGTTATGLQLVLAGYGSSGNGDVGVTVGAASTVKRTGGNIIDALQTTLDNSGLQSRFYVYDFDGPTGAGPTGGPTIGNSLETLVAPGDSGGPSFIRNAGQLQLFGINTFVSPSVSGAPTDYKFGMLGGGIAASDLRFFAWLQEATNGTLGGASSDSGNAPIPGWAVAVLAVGLLSLSNLRRSTGNASARV